jgi:hypothetical protein
MKACAAGYALIYVTPLKVQLISRTAVGLIAAKFKPLILGNRFNSRCLAMDDFSGPVIPAFVLHVTIF